MGPSLARAPRIATALLGVLPVLIPNSASSSRGLTRYSDVREKEYVSAPRKCVVFLHLKPGIQLKTEMDDAVLGYSLFSPQFGNTLVLG